MNANGQLIEALKTSTLFHDYERAYSDATGMPVALRPVETWQLPLHGSHRENGFCAIMAEKSGTCAACLQMQERLALSASSRPATKTCAYGLCETFVPVRLGSETIGFLQTGQVLREQPTEASFQRAVGQAKKFGVNIDHPRAREAYFHTPVVSKQRIDSLSDMLAIFSDHLAMKSNQLAVRHANHEPPVISRARQFIEDHHTEDLSLGQVAQAVHTSLFYFCKLFKKSVGVNFTEYVSRVRTEKAKNLLLNPNLRVSEIAYEVGFQSLTHFNRIFKRIVGESPTAFRGHLPAAA